MGRAAVCLARSMVSGFQTFLFIAGLNWLMFALVTYNSVQRFIFTVPAVKLIKKQYDLEQCMI